MRVSEIVFKNFKRITDLTITGIPQTARLVLIVGPNGSGKSSVFDGLAHWNRINSGQGYLSDEKYYKKNIGEAFNWHNSVTVNFHGSGGPGMDRLYLRTAYRNDPDFSADTFGRPQSPTAAIAVAEKEPIDGALIDINMPVMDGFATCVQLQALAAKAGRPLRIWFMSGAYSGALKRRGLELGGQEVFSKPFDPSNLSKRLEEGFSPAAPPVPLAAVATSSDGEAEMDSQP